MRKILIIGFVALLTIVMTYGFADAKAQGFCSNCHTMHNSQDNLPQAQVYSGGAVSTSATPLGELLKGDCIACHTSTGSTTIVNNTPIVWNTGGYPTQPLAGGNFYNVASAGKTKVHNVANLTATPDIAPPGFKTGVAKPVVFTQGGLGWGPATWLVNTQVTCAGEMGCHGDRSTGYTDYQAVRGAHHADDSTIDGTTVGKSYRFLAGIKGAERNDGNYRWEQTAASDKHNGYFGSTSTNDNTISYLCAECHGKFHTYQGGSGEVYSGGTAQGPWLRHPTDVALTASGGGSFTSDYTTYSTETPVAYGSPTTSTSTVNTSSIVMCLSCHAAHGTDYADIVRFNYPGSISAGNGTNDGGCERCHQRQR